MRLEAPGLKARGYRAVRHEGDSVLEEGEEEEGDEGDKTRRTTRRWGSQPVCLRLVHHTPHCLLLERTWR